MSYTISPSLDRAVDHATEATIHAMDSWSGTVGAPELGPVEDGSGPEKPGFDQRNGIFFMKDGYAAAGRALAITVLTYDNTSGNILDADVIFNGSYAFEVLDPDLTDDDHDTGTHVSSTDGISHGSELGHARNLVYDFHHVVAHELGHSLGMNDEMGEKDALMYRYSAPNDASIRQPAADDIAGLAELYSTTLTARGNGCGNATVAPKKPSNAASHAALLATLGLLVFLALRSKGDKRARVAFVLATAAATVACLPNLSGKSGAGFARASERLDVGHARARVLGTSTVIEQGLFKTTYKLSTTSCRAVSCPKAGHGTAWGGTIGNLTQEVGGYYAPVDGDEVDVSFESLPAPMGPMTSPLAGRVSVDSADVRVLTRALAR